MKDHDHLKKGLEVKSEDIREGLTAVLSICIHEPQFQGQTKGRLNNPEVRSLVESMVRPGSKTSCSRTGASATRSPPG